MTARVTLSPSSAAARSAARAALASHRRRSFDLRRGQADDEQVARLQLAGDDLGEAAVGDAGADVDRLRLLLRVEEIDGLRTRRRRAFAAAASARQLRRRAGRTTRLSAAGHALGRVAAPGRAL